MWNSHPVGTLVHGKKLLPDTAVLRVGRAVLVFHADLGAMVEPTHNDFSNMAGSFHSVEITDQLRDASFSAKHILLSGPSGTGKELAAGALAQITGTDNNPTTLLSHNCAAFSSEEEATTTIFGVGPKVFTGVSERAGLLEQSHGGMLFLDEVHNLPTRVQRSLLRVIEDGQYNRFGETTTRTAAVRLVLASNQAGETCGLAPDLFPRLRLVKIPPLSKRRADIPCIFHSVLEASLARHSIAISAVVPYLGGDHYEALCVHDFANDNVRGIVDIADRISSRIAGGTSPETTVLDVFSDKFGDGPVAQRASQGTDTGSVQYEQNKGAIMAAYRECGGNVSKTERLLKSQGINCSRRWLSVYLERWGLKGPKV